MDQTELRKKIIEKVFGFVITEDAFTNLIVMDEEHEAKICIFVGFLNSDDDAIRLLHRMANTGHNGIQYHWEIGGPVLGKNLRREHYCKIRYFGRPEDKGVVAYHPSLQIAIFKAVEMILDGKYEE